MLRQRPAAAPAPGPLEADRHACADRFDRRKQRAACRRSLAGLLLPAERTTPVTALAHAEPIVGAQPPPVQALPGLLSESTGDAAAGTARRLDLRRRDPTTAPAAHGALVIDETGDRKSGTKTAHLGRQDLGRIGKVDRGGVTGGSLWADARVCYPLVVEPVTPTPRCPRGLRAPAYRTTPQRALDLVQQAVAAGLSFRAVVADSCSGEDER